MFSFFYNICLMLLGLFALPKFLLSWSKYKGTILYRLGLKPPDLPLSSTPVIWIHAVSAGETKAAIPLVAQLQQTFPFAQIVVSNTTRAGHMEAKKIYLKQKLIFFFLWIFHGLWTA